MAKRRNISEDFSSYSWQKVEIDRNPLFNNNEEFEGLVGLEVLNDYPSSLVSTKKALKRISEKKKKKKSLKVKKKKIDPDSEIIHDGISEAASSGHENRKPGRFVLLNPETYNDSDDNDFEEPEGWTELNVPESIVKSLKENGFRYPTEIQEIALRNAMYGSVDIVGAAETGSGKTLAFGIPILTGIMKLKSANLEESNKPLYALILTPTRELAVQIRNHLVVAAKYTGIKIDAIFGGLSIDKQERILSNSPEIVVATPGRLWELLQQSNPHLNKIVDIRFLVIDETDRMVEKGHFEELRKMLHYLNSNAAKVQVRQNFIFSATLTMIPDLPLRFGKNGFGKKNKSTAVTSEMKLQKFIEEVGISKPKIIDLTKTNPMAQRITETRLICSIDEKDFYLYYFTQRHPGRTIVFCNSINCVKRLASLFKLLDCEVFPLHANMIQKQRLKNLEKFKVNTKCLLIATDVAARGLDIPFVQHVIHYQVPRTSENYVHRSGRTARANRDGFTIILMEPGELKDYVKICKTLKKNEDLPLFPIDVNYMPAIKKRVRLACDVESLELKVRRSQSQLGWSKKTAEKMDMIIDNEYGEWDNDLANMERKRDHQTLHRTKTELKKLLQHTLIPKDISIKYREFMEKPLITSIENTNSEVSENTAIKVTKQAINELKLLKRKRNRKKI